jgi:hypothetical protein
LSDPAPTRPRVSARLRSPGRSADPGGVRARSLDGKLDGTLDDHAGGPPDGQTGTQTHDQPGDRPGGQDSGQPGDRPGGQTNGRPDHQPLGGQPPRRLDRLSLALGLLPSPP